jgi:hypothetical protein
MNFHLVEFYRRHFERFCAEQLKISTPNPGELIPLVFNDSQKILLEKIEKQRKELGYIRYCCCKSRQSTMSTFAQALCFHSAVTTREFNSLLIANDESTTADIFGIASRFATHMGEDVRPMMRHMNKQELKFENPDKRKRTNDPGLGSKLVFQSATKITAGTGSTRHAVHLSEISKWNEDSVELLFSSILPAIHLKPGTIIIKESTPYVGGTDFREMCESARNGEGDDIWHFIPWFCDSKNWIPLKKGEKFVLDSEEKKILALAKRGQKKDQVPPVEVRPEQFAWRRKKIKELKSEIMFAQEYSSTFEEGWIRLDATVFDHARLLAIKSNLRPPRRFVDVQPGPKINTVHTESGLRDVRTDINYVAIWEEPKENVKYDIGADIAVGSNEAGDWSVAQVLRRDTREQVAEVHMHVDPKDFGTLLYWLGIYYNVAQLVVEMNGPGFATHGQISSMAYPYIYIWRHRERDVPTMSNYRGWKTQQDSKQLMLSNTVHRFNHNELIVHSRLLWDEMYDYVQIAPGVFRASIGNDDAVTALMIGIQGGEDETFGEDAQTAQQQSIDNRPVAHRDPALHDEYDPGKRMDTSLREFIQDMEGV